MANGERVWITDAQRVTLDLLGILAAVGKELNSRAADGERITQDHYWAYISEEVVRNIPPGTHYLRNAYDGAQATCKAEREAWRFYEESGYFSTPRVPVQRSTD